MSVSSKCRNGSSTFRLANWGLKQRSGSRGADHLLIQLAALCNTSHRCTLSDAGIAKYFDLKKRSVTRYLAILRDGGFIRARFEGPGRSKRVITFCVEAEQRQSGAGPTPFWHANPGQNGAQNLAILESRTGNAPSKAQRPVPQIAPGASAYEAAMAYRSVSERVDDGEGGFRTSQGTAGHRRGS